MELLESDIDGDCQSLAASPATVLHTAVSEAHGQACRRLRRWAPVVFAAAALTACAAFVSLPARPRGGAGQRRAALGRGILKLSGDKVPEGSLGALIAAPGSSALPVGNAASTAAGCQGSTACGNATEKTEKGGKNSNTIASNDATNETTALVPDSGAYGWYTTQLSTIIREQYSLHSKRKYVLPKDRMVYVVEQIGRRVRITIPMPGWMSLHTEDGREILHRNGKPPTADDLVNNLEALSIFRHPDGSLDPQLLAQALQDGNRSSPISPEVKDNIRKAVHNMEQLGHGFKGISEKEVDKAVARAQKKERSYEAAVSKVAGAVFDAKSEESEKEFTSDAEKEIAHDAAKVIADRFHSKVDIPAEVPDSVKLPKTMPKELAPDKLKENGEKAAKDLAKDLGQMFSR